MSRSEIQEPQGEIALGSNTGLLPDPDPAPAPPIVRSARSFFPDGGVAAEPDGNRTLMSSDFLEKPGYGDQFTFAWWQKLVDSPGSGHFAQHFQMLGQIPPSTATNHGFHIGASSSDILAFIVRQDASIIKQYIVPGNSDLGIGYTPKGVWNFHMVTWNGPGILNDKGNNTIKWYINGNDVSTIIIYFIDGVGSLDSQQGVRTAIGGAYFFKLDPQPTINTSGWPGFMGACGIWNKVLTIDHAIALHVVEHDITKEWNTAGWDDDYTEADAAALVHYWPYSDEHDRFRDEGNAIAGIQRRRVNEGRDMLTNEGIGWSSTDFPGV